MIAFPVVGYGLAPGRLDPPSRVANPIGIDGLGTELGSLQALGWVLVIAVFAAAGYATVVRLRGSDRPTRQQVKWVAYAAALLGVLWGQFMVTNLWPVRNRAVADVEIAILRHHLFDIDVIIRRTIVYALLVTALFGV